MLLKKLVMSNFRQFKDKEEILFSQNKDSNITLILGENTSGKTTILQAFLWCLYGKVNFKRKERLFNEENATEMENGEKREISVTIELEHLEKDYIIKRTQECNKNGNEVKLSPRSELSIFVKEENGELLKLEDYQVEKTISEMLSPELAEYFFYDTERFGNITEKKDVTSAVKGLLGLTILENTIKHLGTRHRNGTVINSFYKEIDKEGNVEFNQLNEKIKQLEEEIETRKQNIETYKNEIEKYENFQREKEEELKGFAETEAIKGYIDKGRQQLRIKEEEYQQAQSRFVEDFKRNTLSYFLSPLIKEVKKFLETTQVQDDYIEGMDASSIHHIIERGKCVCGTEIEENTPQFEELKKTLKFIPPESLGSTVQNYKNYFQVYMDNARNFYDTVDKSYSQIIKVDNEISHLKDEVSNYEELIGDFEQTKNIKQSIDFYKEKIKTLSSNKVREDERKNIAEEQLREYNNKIEKMLEANEKNKDLIQLLTYAEEVKKIFENDLQKRQNEVRKNLEERVNYYFQKIYHGDRFVRINDKYRVELLSQKDGIEYITDDSAGLETVKNFAYIAGLVDLAKQKLGNDKGKKEEDLKYGLEEDYPLVLDAAFSNVDEEHVLNISRVLPKVTGQLILIVMDKDWNYASEELDHLVGVKYRIIKNTETYSKIIKE